ncbi:arylesterase [Streptomyces sp. NBRC 110611]|uniref:hypothetical protein n=1 Tax=Streptomyces sp. NBRC 110611 TaxID=1621259 RepID=UPI000836692A|nr:hypothetical protein [Streptomyces sp. NBRC 110611]GAU65536.1 arylesterase [Streptomyces sp. NBRC 110611]
MRKPWFALAAFLIGAFLAAVAVGSFVQGDVQSGTVSAIGAILATAGGIYALKRDAVALPAKLTMPVLLAVIISVNLPRVLDGKGGPLTGVAAAAAAGLVIGLFARFRPSGRES